MFIRNKQYPQYFDIQNSLLSTDTEFWVTNVSFSSMSTACLTIKRLEITKEKTISIGKQHIKYSKNKFILFSNAFLTILRNSNQEIIGVSLEKQENKIELYGQIQNWISVLMKECISLDFTCNYQILKLIGRGSTANVYQVRSKIDDINYAIKVFDKAQLETDNQVKQSLLFEIQYLKLFNHPNIVKYLGVFESKSQIILIQELLLGGDLDSNIQERKLDEDQIKIIMKSILGGLDYMHSFGIFHRDIKKCNIMLRQQNNYESLCLIDFGLAEKANSENNYLFRYCGTPGCVAPEILRKQQYGLKVDIYSVGILGYQLMFGKDPFKSNTTKEIIVKNFLGHIDFSDTSSISKSGIYFLKGLIEIDPQIRFSAAQALKHPFLQPEINKILVNGNRFNVHIRKEPLKLKPLLFHNSRNQSPNNVSKTSPSKFHLKTDMSPKSDREKSNIDSSRLISKSFFQRNYKKMNTK
ncbi:unnamed protein product (macronuclear) [Paramecium tetraurelia]|uniref:Protein kinase domain-containing protein n=1 Tax=Paramecium tetraurelia TaxID=5888 RepID=A0DFT5_PARTE|nr:uncharacterized protein GSPATT00016715001 [Paramecium tetraurelia]CAK81902.1 unnamed protein product [Paramecium tetraurelia]|eukprot:XP_001449299.1 hypothetical protein (macronuclear) [Paramecium tetraurelia strain d4-2]